MGLIINGLHNINWNRLGTAMDPLEFGPFSELVWAGPVQQWTRLGTALKVPK